MKSMPLNVRQWKYPECSTEHELDIIAALNIKALVATVNPWTQLDG